MGTRKHTMPAFLSESVSAEAYERWLTRKAAAHVKRDRKRSNSGVTQSLYKEAVHAAVVLADEVPIKGFSCIGVFPIAEDDSCMNGLFVQGLGYS